MELLKPPVPPIPQRPTHAHRSFVPWSNPETGPHRQRRVSRRRQSITQSVTATTTIQHLPSFGNISEATALVLLEDWLRAYEEEQWHFNSIALYGELKLTEARRIARHLPRPNCFMTSLACNMLGQLVPAFGAHAELVRVLYGELLRSIYVDFESSLLFGDATPALHELQGSATYYARSKQLAREIKELKAVRNGFLDERNNLLRERERRVRLFNSTVKHWQHGVVGHVFRAWQKYVALQRTQLRKIGLVFERWWRKNDKLRWYFGQWHTFHQLQRGAAIIATMVKDRESIEAREAVLERMREGIARRRVQVEEAAAAVTVTRKRILELQNSLETSRKELGGAEGDKNELEVLAAAWAGVGASLGTAVLRQMQSIVQEAAAPELSPTSSHNNNEAAKTVEHTRVEEKALGWCRRQLKLAKGSGDCEASSEHASLSELAQSGELFALTHRIRKLSSIPAATTANENTNSDSTPVSRAACLLSAVSSMRQSAAAHLTFGLDATSKEEAEEIILSTPEELVTGACAPVAATVAELVSERALLPASISADGEVAQAVQNLRTSWLTLNVSSSNSAATVPPTGPCASEQRKRGSILVATAESSSASEISFERIVTIRESFSALRYQISDVLSRQQEGREAWAEVSEAAEEHAWNAVDAFAVAACAPEATTPGSADSSNNEEAEEFGRIDPGRLKDILPNGSTDPQWKALDDAAIRWGSVSGELYRNYVHQGGTTLDTASFYKLAKDARLPSKRLTLGEIERLLSLSGTSTDHELLPHQFVETMVRVAYAKFGENDTGRGNEASDKENAAETVSARFDMLMERYLEPHLRKSHPDDFRAEIHKERFQRIVSGHRVFLKRLFRTSCTGESKEAMTMADWIKFLRRFELLSGRITIEIAERILTQAQIIDDDHDHTIHGAHHEVMVFGEWVTALALASAYCLPDPYTAVDDRLDQFVQRIIEREKRMLDTQHTLFVAQNSSGQ